MHIIKRNVTVVKKTHEYPGNLSFFCQLSVWPLPLPLLTVPEYRHGRFALRPVESVHDDHVLLARIEPAEEKRQFVPDVDPHPLLSRLAEKGASHVTTDEFF